MCFTTCSAHFTTCTTHFTTCSAHFTTCTTHFTTCTIHFITCTTHFTTCTTLFTTCTTHCTTCTTHFKEWNIQFTTVHFKTLYLSNNENDIVEKCWILTVFCRESTNPQVTFTDKGLKSIVVNQSCRFTHGWLIWNYA